MQPDPPPDPALGLAVPAADVRSVLRGLPVPVCKGAVPVLLQVQDAGKLTVQKIVTGNMANSDDTFNVTVRFTPEEGKKLKSKIAGRIIDNNLGNVTITDGEDEQTATFKVKAGTTVVFTNIPEGVSYEVEETRANGYDAPAYKVNTKEGNTGTIVGGKTDEAIITNNKGTLIDTGVFMNNLPYLLVLIFAAACGVGFVVSKKRR